MTKIIPPIISDKNLSGAEIKTFYMFQEMDMECVVLHSLGLASHIEKVFGEIDFLVVSKDGILSLEVKGGGLAREDGVYYHIDRKGERHISSESPFKQVLKNMYSLRDYVKNVFSKDSSFYKCQYACGLIFPDMKFDIKDPEIIQDIVFDNTYKSYELKYFIKKAFSYWKNKTKKSLGFECCKLSSAEIRILGKRLRGDFSCVPSLGYITDEIDKQLIELTEQQYESLKMISENKKILVKGFAGTGKTVLAFEHAKRQALEGKRVLYLCFNKLLSTFLLQNLNKDINTENNKLAVNSFHGYLNKYLNIDRFEDLDQENFFTNIMPDKFLDYVSKNPMENRFDILIIDEGQDLLRISYAMCLNELLSGGFEKGNWCIFLDPNQNIYNNDFIEGYNLIQDYSPTIINLKENCRNTYKISKYNKNLTGFSTGDNKKIIGEDVEVSQYENKTDLMNKVVKFVKRLINQGVRPGDIVILSPNNFKNSSFLGKNYFEDICKFQDISGRSFNQYYEGHLKFSTIHNFKGMESKIIILMDLEEISNEYHRLLNYIGISRAKVLLYIFFNKDLTNDYYQIMNANK